MNTTINASAAQDFAAADGLDCTTNLRLLVRAIKQLTVAEAVRLSECVQEAGDRDDEFAEAREIARSGEGTLALWEMSNDAVDKAWSDTRDYLRGAGVDEDTLYEVQFQSWCIVAAALAEGKASDDVVARLRAPWIDAFGA